MGRHVEPAHKLERPEPCKKEKKEKKSEKEPKLKGATLHDFVAP